MALRLPRDWEYRGNRKWTKAALGAVYVLAAVYMLSLFIGSSHRAVYDRIADARVILRPPDGLRGWNRAITSGHGSR